MAGRRKGGHTQDFASFTYTINDIFLLDRITHRDLRIPLELLAQSKPLVIVTFGSKVQNPAHAKALKFADMLFGRDIGPQVEKVR
jgi:hypothetical protein